MQAISDLKAQTWTCDLVPTTKDFPNVLHETEVINVLCFAPTHDLNVPTHGPVGSPDYRFQNLCSSTWMLRAIPGTIPSVQH